jgi:hypothetical protein
MTEVDMRELNERAERFCAQLTYKLRARGHKVETKTTNVGIRRNGIPAFRVPERIDGMYVHFTIEAQHTDWGRYTGKLYISLRGSGRTRMFPEPKAGFDLDKMVQRVLDQAAKRKAYEDSEKARKAEREKKYESNRRLNKAIASTKLDSSAYHVREHGVEFHDLQPSEAKALALKLKEIRS